MSQKSTVIFRRWALMPFVSANGCSTLGNCGTSRSLRENFYRLDLYSIIRQCISPCPGSPGVPWDSYRLTLSVLRDIEVRFGSIADIRIAHAMSALPPKADMCGAVVHVCFGPIADIKTLDPRVAVPGEAEIAKGRNSDRASSQS